MVTETSQTSQTISTVSGASVYLGGYGMRSGPGSLTLDPGFIANIEPLINAASKNKYDAVSRGGCGLKRTIRRHLASQAHGHWWWCVWWVVCVWCVVGWWLGHVICYMSI